MSDFMRKSGKLIRFSGILFLFLNIQYLSAQSEFNNSKIILSVSEGSKIYSADESFNYQITQKRIILKESFVSQVNSSEMKYLVIDNRRITGNNHNNPASQNRRYKIGSRKKSEDLQKIKQQIASFRVEKAKLRIKIKSAHASGGFFKTHYVNKHYVHERSHQDNHHKFELAPDEFLRLQSLDYLHSQKHFVYNSKSFNYCYSKVFSVRPPPFLV